jgi:hypothetical protein
MVIFPMGDIKGGLYRLAPGIGKAPVKSDVKNIFESEVKRLDGREIAKAIEWLSSHGFSSDELEQGFVYRSFIENAERSPDKEV